MFSQARRAARTGLLALLLPALLAAAPASAADTGLENEVAMLREELSSLDALVIAGVRLNGYYHFEYRADNNDDPSAGAPSTFTAHHASLFISRTWDQWRIFTELEWEHGARFEADPATGAVQGHGTFNVERSWAEFLPSDAVVVRGGKFLLPHYWNVHHYPNITLSTRRPLMVRRIYPESTSGVMVHGTLFPGHAGFTYHAYVGNGRDLTGEGLDANADKATGGHLTVHLATLLPGFSRVDVGAGFYNERGVDSTGATVGGDYVSGADAQINAGRFELLFEYASRAATVDTAAPPGPPSLVDVDSEGFYLQPAVRVADAVWVFYRYDYLDDLDASLSWVKHTGHTAGVNWKPRPDVALKLEGSTNRIEGPSSTPEYQEMAASLAVFF